MKDHLAAVVQPRLWTLTVLLFITSCASQSIVYTDQNRHYNAYNHQNFLRGGARNRNGYNSNSLRMNSVPPNLIVPYNPSNVLALEEEIDEELQDVQNRNLEDDPSSNQITGSLEAPPATPASSVRGVTPRTLIPRRVYSPYKHDRPFNRFLNYGRRREKPGAELENEILRSKVDTLGSILKLHVQSLRKAPGQAVELVFLVDSSSSVGADNFFNELKFVKKLLADFTVSFNQTRVAVITFSSQDRVNVAINHVSSPTHHNHKCVLLEWQMPRIRFMGGGTYTMGAMLEAQRVLAGARPQSAKAVFLVTDGYSNGGDPRPAAEALKRRGVRIFTFGIRNGNVEELHDMASHPREEHSYILDSFEEFEALARRALHEDLQNGVLMDQNPQACSSLCNASDHTCCDRHASCTCGTHTGHYLCTCQPGYYGTGLQGNCHPCPTGTYRESQSPGDVSSCQACPDPHMTSPQGSTSPHQCYCTRGYDQIAMRCHKRQCPPLSPPANGYFIPASCSNVVNAACGVRCSAAYRLEGSSIRLCREDGTWSGGDTRCVMKTCRPLLSPSHGQMKCTFADGRIDTECYFGCDPGYNLVGSVRRTCLPVAMWDGIPAHCKPVFCPPLPPLRHGTIAPHSCLAGKSRYGALCNFTCSVGFMREGLSNAHCGGHGQWAEGTGQVRCIDIQPPLLKCPAHIATTALHNENYANVTWEEPFAKDNSKGEVILTTIPATTVPMKLLIGQHTITYQAKDTWGNMDSCQFLVQVADSQPPRVDWCESPPTFLAGEDEVDVYWEEPLFSDNSRSPVKVTRSLDPGRFPQGSTVVQYEAEDESGNTATCNITITVQKHACQLPLDPINGSANCTEDPDAVFCSFMCEDGYAFAMRPEQDYFCAYDGVWRPDNSPLNFPDCSVTTVSNTISQTGEMAIDSDGSVCDDIFFMGQVENQLESRLEIALNAMCSDDVVCEVAAVEAVCEGLLAEAEEEATNMFYRKKRSLVDADARDQFWAGEDHSRWRYWQREDGDLDAVHYRTKRSLNEDGGRFVLESPDSLIDHGRSRRQLGLLQPMFMSSGSFGNREAEQGDRQSAKGEYLGVLIDIIVRSLGTDISFNRFATFLTGLKQENGQFGSNDFMAAFSTEFGEGKAEQLRELAARKFGSHKIFSGDNLSSINSSSPSIISSSSFSSSTENSLSSLTPEDVEVIREMVAGSSLSLQNVPARLEMPPTSGTADIDLPQSDQAADPRMAQHSVRIQGLQKVVQSVSRSNFKVRFQVQGQGDGAREGMGQAMEELLSAAGRGDFDILFGDRLLRVAAIRLAEDPEYLCEAGSVPQDNQCVKCPIGTFFNVVMRECQSCPQGSYQPEEGQVTCLVCPENTSTKKELARSTQDCKAYCLPGSYSADGLEPCTTCAVGEYQDEYSSYSCATCPHATTTWRRGSWLLEDCKPMCPPGQVSETGLFPCFSCPRDHFQHLQGATHCYRCPNTSTSDTMGASSINSCEGMEETFKGAYTSLEVLTINDCFSLPCSNGGSCAPLEFGYICVCQPGYSGVQCEIEVNECGSEPCLHGGQCQDLLGAYECLCVDGYQGDQCQENIDDCALTPCLNGATCMDGVAEYTCLCPPGYTGDHCETDINDCAGDPCSSGSTCEDLLNDFRCACAPGFQGRQCEIRVDHCESSPCEHGACAAIVNDYSCTCEPGYTGRNCDTNIDECVSNPCLNGGLCTDWINSYTCTCQPGFTGGQCGQELTTNFVLHFPTSSIMNYALLETLPDALSEISVCFWMRSSDRDNYGTPFSYATQHHDNAFTLTDYNGFVLCVNGEKRITDVRGNDGLWHLVCVTWSGTQGGAWRLFVDGALKDSGDDLAPGAIITADGAWVLGQEQDERGGRYNPQESFVGDLSHFNIWNTFMTAERAEALFWLCDRYVGNVRGWPDFQAGIRGQVTLQSSTFCHGCFPPAVPASGRLEAVSTGRGGGEADTKALLRVVCDSGYKLRRGLAERQCLVTGLWSGDDPICERLSCGYPGYLRNGKMEGTRYRFGDTVLATCEFGYRLDGSASRTCQEDGNWSGEQPSCNLISCNRPPPAPNMEVAAPNAILPNTRVAYSCDRGYQMDGPSTQTCGRDGQWDGSQPSCQASSCAVLPNIYNGEVRGNTPVAPGATVFLTCDSGFNLQGGPPEILCGTNGQWPSRLPRCVRNKCPKPPVVENGSVRVRASTTGREAGYRCQMGYVLEGRKTLHCLVDGTWDGPFSKCVTKPCPTPSIPEHGKLVETKAVWRVGETATYTCEEGFMLDGNGDVHCVDDYEDEGMWDLSPPTCSVVMCPALAEIPNGKHTFTNRPAQAGSSFSGRVLDFPQGELEVSRRKKRSFGAFPSPGQSSSADYDYGQLSQSSGFDYYGQSSGGQSISDYDYGQVSGGFEEFSQSQSGFELGQSQSLDFGNFDQSAFSKPPPVPSVYDTEVEYTCRPGYKLIGSKKRRCDVDGEWDTPTPNCYEQYCVELHTLENGYPTYHGSGVSSRVEFDCNEGYQLEGDFEMVCQPDKSWLGSFPACTVINCGEPPDLENGTVSFTDTTFGEVAVYDCYMGYVLEGSFERFCTNERFWNGSMPRCIGVTCRVPPVIDNGYITFEGSLYVGSPIEYECKECYELNGTRFRYCQVDGTWDLVQPTCDMIYCDALPDTIPNGRIIGNDNSCGSLVEFECDPGYEMNGRQRSTCSEYKRWSAPVPTCERISCGSPGVLDYGRVIGDSFTFTDKVTYECSDGYVLRGSNIRLCEVDGYWSDSSPYCDIKNCTKPNGPSNGRVRLSGLFYGSTANIVCDPGFRLDGPRNLRCTENAVWDQEMPYCLPIICPAAALVRHGSYNSTERQFESFTVLNYTCDTGYYTTATETRMLCNAVGVWEGTPITCQIKNCGDPGTLPNGRILGRDYNYGKVVRFECEEGYNLLGEATATCTADGSWSNYATSCTQITCEDPTFIENAKLVLDNSAVVFGTSLYYECEKGYLIQGTANLTCQRSGRWSQSAPECGIVTCPIPAEDFNAVRYGDMFEYDSVINYTCNEGFIMDGSPSLKCLETGEWSDDFPVCEMISCSPPDDIENGSYESRKMSDIPIKTEPSQQLISPQAPRRTKSTKSGRLVSLLQQSSMREGVLYHFGDVIEYACDEGHSMNSDGIMTCTEDGWSLPPPTCHAITCPVPITIRNGDVIGDDVAYGAVLEYRCDEGYEIVGVQRRTCQANKEWSDTEPFCRIIECQRPASLDDGRTIGTSIKYKSVLSYVCDSGFKLEGVSTRVCQSDGHWTGEQPECIEVFCSVPETVPNAIQDVSTTKVGDTARYSCMEGYRREGAAVLNCQESGLWDHDPPTCVQIDCGEPPSAANLIVTGEATVYDSQVTYSCERGYRLEGADWNTCMQAGIWSSPAPVCWQISCPDPKKPANGYIIAPPEKLVLTSTALPSTTSPTTTTPAPTTTAAGKKGSKTHSRKKRARTWGMFDVNPYEQRQQSQQLQEGVKQSSDQQLETSDEAQFVFVVDDIVRYGCNEGFFTDSTAPEAKCTVAGVWSAPPIQCRRVACGSPPLPEHTSARGLHGDSFLYGSQYMYTCLQGYTMKNWPSNSTTLTCGADGQWAGTLPQCQPVHCGDFQKLDDATYSVEAPDPRYPLSLGTIVTFTCENGHRMNGRGVLQCDTSGNWEGEGESHCEEELCKDIPRVLNTTNTFDRDARPQTVTYSCRDGFKIQGNSSTLTCSFGQWSEVNFSCLPVNCYEPTVPANGKITARHFSLGSVATYSCTEGHTLRGEGSVVCGADGLWHGNVPYCEPVHCGMPQSPDSGSVSVSGTVYQSQARYSCVRGYFLRGNSSRICDERGDWSGHMPSCYRKDCGEVAPPRNGFVMGVSTLYGDRVRFGCEVGHVLTGASVATCQHTGNWSDTSPTCKAVKCPAPSVPPNTEFSTSSVNGSLGHIYNTTLGFRCLEGHIPRGDLSIRCREDGTWSPFMGQCSKLSCGRPTVNSDGAIILGRSFYYKDRVTVKCPEGSSTSGPSVLSCQSDGTWSSSASCTASCSRQCQNGGVCISSSRCSCKPGYYGDRCQHARCSLSCLNGGWCSGPHKCKCQPGYGGRRCHRPTCSSGCVGGRCIGPNVCLCPHGLTGSSCPQSQDYEYSDYQDVLPQTNYDDWDVAALRRRPSLDDEGVGNGQ